ncbi:MAG: sensor histidine kinase [Alphaproteobacteria bacterium]|nr:MAG: sensor histidine kinase [Alphaproteobacteria bacterium]
MAALCCTVLLILAVTLGGTSAEVRELSLRRQLDQVRLFLEPIHRYGIDGLPQELRHDYRTGTRMMVIRDADNHETLASLPPLAVVQLSPLLGAPPLEQTADDPEGLLTGMPVYALTRRVMMGGEPVLVTVADTPHRDTRVLDSVVTDQVIHAAVLLVPAVVLFSVLAVVAINRALDPLDMLSRHAAHIGPMRADFRLPLEAVPLELHPLVQALNDALARLDDGFAMQRRFTADAAHQLRTPLAVIAARLDSLGPFEGQAALKADVRRIGRIVSQLLSVARLEGQVFDLSATLEINDLAAEVVSQLAPLAHAHGRRLALSAYPAPVWVRGDRAALIEALSNLIDNAIGFTTPDSSVEVEVRAGAILVLDRGPGVPDREKAAVFARFRGSRLDSRHGGAGLGLSIALEIMKRHGGTVRLNDRVGGGAIFSLTFGSAAISTGRDRRAPASGADDPAALPAAPD